MSEQLERVQVVTAGGAAVEITAAGRAAITESFARLKDLDPDDVTERGRRAFEEAGASGPIQLDEWTGANVLDAINDLAKRAGGIGNLPADIAELQGTLKEEAVAQWSEKKARAPRLRGLFRGRR